MGEYGRRDRRVAVEAPLSDTISGKISVLQQKSDGFYKARYKTHPDYSVPAKWPLNMEEITRILVVTMFLL